MVLRNSPWTSDVTQFNTVYDSAIYEWKLSIVRDFLNVFNFPFRVMEERDVQLCLAPRMSTRLNRTDYFLKCIFELRIEEPTTKKILYQSPIYKTEEQEVNVNFYGFIVPLNSTFGRSLMEVFSESSYITKTCHMTVTMIMNKSDYGIQKGFANTPSLLSDGKDFRFDPINNKSRHDFSIRTLKDNSKYSASREALFICSSYFRNKIFEDGVERDSIELNTSLEALRTTVVYALTGTFSPPTKLTVELTNEILTLSQLLNVRNRREFTQVIEKLASEQLHENRMHLESVLEWLMTAREMSLARLENAASAIVIRLHFADLKVNYEDNENCNGSSLHHRLHEVHRIFRNSAYLKLLHLKRISQSVHCIE